MWDLMYPKGHTPKSYGHRSPSASSSSSSGGKRCGACRARIGIARLLNGQKINLNYCEKHYCKMPTSAGTICTAQNNGRTQYCDHHIQCHATGDEGRCWRFVKEESPTKFKYCKDHSCAFATCATRRTDPSNPHCIAHRCGDLSCDKPKQVGTGSFYCEKHTCLATSCSAQIPSTGNAKTDATHFCDLHRTCAASNCTRRCHIRDNMVLTRWCGAHYCTASDYCDEKRAEDSDRFCRDHMCLEPGCHGGKFLGGHFCVDHVCKTEGCYMRREHEAEHCGSHICRVEDCLKPAVANRRCETHRRCTVEGCMEWIYVEHGPDGDIRWPECENHHSPRCAAITLSNTPCEKRIFLASNATPGTAPARYCADHSCSFRACPNARPLDSLQFCNAHKCGVAACQDQVKNAMPPSLCDAPLLQQTRLLLAASGGVGGALGGLWGWNGKFCAAHSCLGDGGKCGAEVVGDEEDGVARRHRRRGDEVKRFCQRHECNHRGCRAEATHRSRRGSRGGLCDRHYRRRRHGGGGDMGAGPFGNMGMPPVGMMPGYPPFFGDAGGYETSDESSDSDDGRRPRGLPFGGPFF